MRAELTDSTPAFAHTPVLVAEVMAALCPVKPARILDLTVGGGGHAAALLEALPSATLVGVDRDQAALAAAARRLAPFGQRSELVHATFGAFVAAASVSGAAEPFDAVLADLGASSPQLDDGPRGFSFRFDAPLDMRMGASEETCKELLARLTADELADILFHLGDERAARSIARAIVLERPATTFALAAIVRSVYRRRGHQKSAIDPATKTFMALRMAVNDELGQIRALLAQLPALVRPAGRFAAIAFHSGEDRLIKAAFGAKQTPCSCSPLARACTCQAPPLWRPIGRRPLVASELEGRANSRARSAKLRLAERTDAPTPGRTAGAP